jgi:hypothetical protein
VLDMPVPWEQGDKHRRLFAALIAKGKAAGWLLSPSEVGADACSESGSMVTMVTMVGDLQPGCLADRLLTGLGQPQINP